MRKTPEMNNLLKDDEMESDGEEMKIDKGPVE